MTCPTQNSTLRLQALLPQSTTMIYPYLKIAIRNRDRTT
jgi:hypothetical protein